MLRLFHRAGLIPRRCTWEITLACNLRCGHCGSRAGQARADELSREEALRVVDELAALGCQHVTLGGGEPTLRADWTELIARLREKGVRGSLISNGLTWSRELTARAREAGIPEEIISLIPRLARLRREAGPPDTVAADNIGYYGEHEETLRNPGGRIPFWVGCRAGLDVLGIESHGDVKGCLSLPSELNGRRDFVEGNLRERPLAGIWHDPDAFAYNRRFRVEQLRGGCAGCEYGEICRGGCTWTSVGHHGHPHEFPLCYHQLTRDRP
jgi:radical SAM protein with 4Fe4S-binding SPASM domain